MLLTIIFLTFRLLLSVVRVHYIGMDDIQTSGRFSVLTRETVEFVERKERQSKTV